MVTESVGQRILHLKEQGWKSRHIRAELGLTAGQYQYQKRKAIGGEDFMEDARKRQRNGKGKTRAERLAEKQLSNAPPDVEIEAVTKALALYDYITIEAGLNEGYVATVGEATGSEKGTVRTAIEDAMRRAT